VKRFVSLQFPNLRASTSTIDMRAQCSKLHQNVLPEDGSLGPKYVARNRIYFNDI
jgi:hypothetical protein